MSKEKCVIFDIDGTISDQKNRLYLVKEKPKDWDKFFEESVNDEPLYFVKEIYDNFVKNQGYHIILMTGRPERYREITENWLEKYGFKYTKLLMRSNNSKIANVYMKEYMLKGILDKYDVVMAFEDNDKVIELFKKYNIPSLKVISKE